MNKINQQRRSGKEGKKASANHCHAHQIVKCANPIHFANDHCHFRARLICCAVFSRSAQIVCMFVFNLCASFH